MRLMMLSSGYLCWYAGFAHWKWRKAYFRSIDHWIICWRCCWARCWMLQDMDHIEASWVFYVKVGRFHQLGQSKISVLTVTSLPIVVLTVYHDSMGSVWFKFVPGEVLRQPSPDVFSVEKCALYIYQKWDISYRSSRYIPANKQTTSDRLTANCGTIGILCSYTRHRYPQPYSARIEGARWLSLVPFWFVAKYIIVRTSHFFSWTSSSPFHNSKSWLQNYFNQIRLKPNQAERQALQTIRHPMWSSSNKDAC